MSNPWDIPPLPAKGDDEEATTHEAVSRALSAWEAFELDFSHMFGGLIGFNHAGLLPAMRAYGSVLTFRGRSDMLKAASEAFFLKSNDSTLEQEVSDLIKKALNYSPRRNEIAHGIVLPYWDFYFLERTHRPGFCCGATAYATNKQKLTAEFDGEIIRHTPKYCYTSVELNHFRDRFYHDLMVPARVLAFRIIAQKNKQPPKASP